MMKTKRYKVWKHNIDGAKQILLNKKILICSKKIGCYINPENECEAFKLISEYIE